MIVGILIAAVVLGLFVLVGYLVWKSKPMTEEEKWDSQW